MCLREEWITKLSKYIRRIRLTFKKIVLKVVQLRQLDPRKPKIIVELIFV